MSESGGFWGSDSADVGLQERDEVNEKESIYRCGWCGFPTDDKGMPLEIDNDEADEYIKKHKDDVNVSTNGHCCAQEQHERHLQGE